MSDVIDGVRSERVGRAAVITLDRPDALNAMTLPMIARFDAAVAAAAEDPAVLAIVLTGGGRAFCSGFDVAMVAEMARSGDRRLEERGIDPEWPAQFASLLRIGKPVIAAINGVAAGVGFVLALMCDVRVMDAEATLTTSFARLGLLAGHGTSWLLPRLIGSGHALDLLWSARTVGADEALRIGLVERIAPPGDALGEALRFVDGLAGSSPHAMARIKAMVHAHRHMDFGAALRDADAQVSAAIGHPDIAEGLAALRERRPPVFAGWPPPPPAEPAA